MSLVIFPVSVAGDPLTLPYCLVGSADPISDTHPVRQWLQVKLCWVDGISLDITIESLMFHERMVKSP